MASFTNYQKASGNLWRYDMRTGAVEAVNPANAETIGKAKGFNSEIRESVYLPTADLVLFSNFVNGKQVAYDPAKNRWVVLNIDRRLERQGTVSDTLVYDARRDLVWNLNAYKAIYVLKIDPKALVLSDDPTR
jgi:streptogramin lyase